MRKSFATVLVVGMLMASFVNNPALANESEFKISDYIPEKFEDFRWRLNGNFNLSGDNQEDETSREYTDYSYDFLNEFDRSTLRANLATNASYEYVTVQKFFNTFGELSTDFGKSTSNRWDSRFFSGDAGPDHSEDRRDESSTDYRVSSTAGARTGQYLSGDFFVSANLTGGWSYNRIPKDETDLEETDTDTSFGFVYFSRDTELLDGGSEHKSSSINLEIMPGWGRVYRGVYAATALYMIDELRSQGALVREPTRDEMLELSDIIYQNRMRHVVDERIHRLESLDQILVYLIESGVTTGAGPYGHLLIQDVWDYFPRDSRRFGLKTTAGIGVRHSYFKNQSTEDGEGERLYIQYPEGDPEDVNTLTDESYTSYEFNYDRTQSTDVYLAWQLEYYRPLTRKWQLDLYTDIEYVLDNSHKSKTIYVFATDEWDGYYYLTDIQLDREIDTEWELHTSATARYIHDSRTSLTFNAYYIYLNSDFGETRTTIYDATTTDEATYDGSENNWRLGLSASLDYRISIPTTLTVRGSYLLQSREYVSEDWESSLDSDRYSVSVSLQHYLY